ncbi:hypothetical protein D9M69_377530 [compost metagenome]
MTETGAVKERLDANGGDSLCRCQERLLRETTCHSDSRTSLESCTSRHWMGRAR